MENATKALLIAAGVLIGIMLLSLLLMAYNQLSAYYSERTNMVAAEQLEEFNKNFENYHRNNIRGTDLISLMNRIIDYNQRLSYTEGTNYTRIGVTIKVVPDGEREEDILNQFKYEINESNKSNELIKPIITNKIGTASRINDENLIKVTGTEQMLIKEAEDNKISGLTSEKLQRLSANIANIMINETSNAEMAQKDREKRSRLFLSILGRTDFSQKEITTIKEITSKYYQYTQFKRAYFNCINVQYDSQTGRVCEMEFVINTKNINGQTIIVFN